ncbi:hypothetical protein [Stenotrophomonas pictorum]|uniref:hypothetical protein n=1 Tax=Stenotrophomonas pictorum TaxID=86184 RepID=UPI0012FDB2A0|nr:hypothetical protein [Stenotrophomonas pictorum]
MLDVGDGTAKRLNRHALRAGARLVGSSDAHPFAVFLVQMLNRRGTRAALK